MPFLGLFFGICQALQVRIAHSSSCSQRHGLGASLSPWTCWGCPGPLRRIRIAYGRSLLPPDKRHLWLAQYHRDLPSLALPFVQQPGHHGYLSHDGKDITYEILTAVFKQRLNFGQDLIEFFLNKVPDGFDLNLLGVHDYIEHDVSLAHIDAYYGQDPMLPSESLTQDLVARARDGYIGAQEAAQTRLARNATCYESNPECGLTSLQQESAYFEAALLIQGLGGRRPTTASLW